MTDRVLPVAQQAPIRILIIDDHTLFRRGLSALLSRDGRLQVVGDAGDAGEGQRRAAALLPDVILLDQHLPGVQGISALPGLRAAAPQAAILLLTVSEDEQDLMDALQGGAAGYLLKTAEGESLIAAILRVEQGENVIAPEMMSKLVSAYRGAAREKPGAAVTQVLPVPAPPAPLARQAPLSPEVVQVAQVAEALAPDPASPFSTLSPRERDILRGIVQGDSNKQIARDLGIAETTVKIHVQHVLRKLDVSTRVHAAVMATEQGVI